MSEVIIFDRIQLRRGTLADLVTVNETLREGEACVELGTGKFKIGDGSTAWNSLPYQGIWTLADIRRALDLLGSTAEGDIIYKGASGWARLAKGTDGQVLKLASGLPSWGNGVPGEAPTDGATYGRQDGAWVPVSSSGGALDPSTTAEIVPFDDFTRTPSASGRWVITTANAGTVSGTGEASAPGICRLTTGTSTTGRAAISWGDSNTVIVGGGQIEMHCRFRLSALSNGTDTFFCQLMGLLNSWDATATNRIYAAYPSAGGSLTLLCRNSGVDTTDDCSTVLVANTWYRLKLIINAAGNQADLYINDALEATVSVALTTAALRPGSLIGKSAGSTSRNLDLDYYYATQALTTPR